MRRARMLTLLVGVMASGCTPGMPSPDPSSAFDGLSATDAREMPPAAPFPDGTTGPDGGIVFVPASARIDHGVPYRFSLGHCGLQSPLDVDGSFWEAVEGTTPAGAELDLDSDAEMINATSGVIVVIGDEMRFRTESGSVVRFERHEGAAEFPACM